ncbi:MAG: diaminopimelate decarboxylase [Acidobacteria bacterium]|nr:MAG: diaminopimelate decarboxylase [Acidobacteriota bacterium]
MLTQAFEYRNGWLFCDDVPLLDIAREVGTPCYVYSRNAILGNYRTFRAAFAGLDPLICYSVKANSNLTVLRLLREEGSGFDVVSGGELYRLKQVGAEWDKVVFSGVGKSAAELRMALDLSIRSINIESMQELEAVAELAIERETRAAIAFRVNPDIEAQTHPYTVTGLRQHKFGLDVEQVRRLIPILQTSEHLRVTSLGVHIGSQILDMQPFINTFVRLKELADEFRAAGLPLEHLDLGGGVGIPYRGEKSADLAKYATFLKENRGDYRLVFEPGRFVVGNAGVLVNQVLYHKANHGKHFVIVDGAMNDLIRPSLYQAHHEILPLGEKHQSITADVVGPVCESGDFFARDRSLPQFLPGDYLAVMNAGAYGFPLSSNYNSRPRAAEVLVEGTTFKVIRQRETFEDLVRGE